MTELPIFFCSLFFGDDFRFFFISKIVKYFSNIFLKSLENVQCTVCIAHIMLLLYLIRIGNEEKKAQKKLC